MNNLYYIYFSLFKLINIFLISLVLSLTYSNKYIFVLAIIVSLSYLLSYQNLENKFIKKEIYFRPVFLIKRVIEIIALYSFCLVNLVDVVLLILLLDYIVKVTFNESIFEIYYNTVIKIRRKDESKA